VIVGHQAVPGAIPLLRENCRHGWHQLPDVYSAIANVSKLKHRLKHWCNRQAAALTCYVKAGTSYVDRVT